MRPSAVTGKPRTKERCVLEDRVGEPTARQTCVGKPSSDESGSTKPAFAESAVVERAVDEGSHREPALGESGAFEAAVSQGGVDEISLGKYTVGEVDIDEVHAVIPLARRRFVRVTGMLVKRWALAPQDGPCRLEISAPAERFRSLGVPRFISRWLPFHSRVFLDIGDEDLVAYAGILLRKLSRMSSSMVNRPPRRTSVRSGLVD